MSMGILTINTLYMCLGAPSTSITFGITLRKCPTYMYRLHTSGIMVFQNALMPIRSCCVFFGLAVDRRYIVVLHCPPNIFNWI